MKEIYQNNSELLHNAGLKVTPQRLAVIEAVKVLKHPAAEEIIQYIQKTYPAIAAGTVYKILDTLTDKGLIKKVKTDKDCVRYDAVLAEHHHLYCSETERIEDYNDNEITELLNDYFKKKKIPNFEIKEVKLQIVGNFINK